MYERKVIVIKGNHEIFIHNLIDGDYPLVLFNMQHNGFDQTLADFANIPKTVLVNTTLKETKSFILANYPEFFSWIKNLPYYYETENYVFTHAGIDIHASNWRNGNWSRQVWEKLLQYQKINLKKYGFNKKLVMGHLPTVRFTGDKKCPIVYHSDKQKIFIDSGVVFYPDNEFNVLVVED